MARGNFWGDGYIHILIVVVSQVQPYVKTSKTSPFKYVQFLGLQLYLNIPVFQCTN